MFPEKTDGVICVKLIGPPHLSPLQSASYAGLVCYQSELPEVGKMIDVEKRLFLTGHHTTLQHGHFSFVVSGVSVGDVTFGLHLVNPFYNSDQRSGRFCSEMFSHPDISAIERYVRRYWPEVENNEINRIKGFLSRSLSFYQTYLDRAIPLVEKYLASERPNLSKSAIIQNARKIAQEQVRMFIPIIFPTALEYTLNLSSLVALWTTAWNPVLRSITDLMRDLILEKFPEISFMFNPEFRGKRKQDWSPSVADASGCLLKPEYQLGQIKIGDHFCFPDPADMHPIDLLPFKPEMMDNRGSFINGRVHISCATMGQDQRHRTILRTSPKFSGLAYLPPLLADLKSGDDSLLSLMEEWKKLSSYLPSTLSTILAPYGAMVHYEKTGDLNAIFHEMAKRLCWCAQEEIWHLATQLVAQIEDDYPDLKTFFLPPCVRTGVCGEGSRYCGRCLSSSVLSDRKV